MKMYTTFAAASLLLAAATAPARDGNLDPTFGTSGKVVKPYPGVFGPVYVVPGGPFLGGAELQSTGKLIVATSDGASNQDFAALRLNADGSIDSSFGFLGFMTAGFDRSGSSLADFVTDMVVQPDDSILIAGNVAGDSSTGVDFGVVKLTADGQIDTSFGGSGKVVVPFNLVPTYHDDFAYGVAVQSDGKILLAGSAQSGANGYEMAVARLTASGPRDTTFNSSGRLTFGFGGDTAIAYRIVELADGAHLLVVGGANTSAGGRNLFALAKLNVADGSFDSSFGTGGKTTYTFAADFGADSAATDFSELPDGRLMVCGAIKSSAPSNYDFACMRFFADGTPDPAFNAVTIPFDLGDTLYDVPRREKRDAQGRFILAGVASMTGGNADCAMARITPDGQLDASFGNGGRATYDSRVSNTDMDRANGCFGLALQTDGKILAAGYADVDANGDYGIEVVRIIGDTIFANGFEP